MRGGAFAKAGKSLEKFLDLLAGVDKFGHLIDIRVDVQACTSPCIANREFARSQRHAKRDPDDEGQFQRTCQLPIANR